MTELTEVSAAESPCDASGIVRFPERGFASRDRLRALSKSQAPKVVIAHDYLTQRGGAERVVLALLEAFPDARVVTSIYDPDGTYSEFRERDVRSSWLSRFPLFRKDPRRALPLLPRVWSRTRIEDADVVLCSSTGWAHAVDTDAPKIVYCHNPARWLYQTDEYLAGAGRAPRAALQMLGRRLKAWDQEAASSASLYLANSTVVARRIRTTYGIEAQIVHPPAAIPAGVVKPVDGIEPGFLLTVGRARGYKNTEAVAAAVASLPGERLVVVGGAPAGTWPARIHALHDVSDAELRWLYANASALIACGYEDFGLTPIEAYSAGTPAVVLKAGGYLDTMVPGVTGEFVRSTDPGEIADGIRRLRERTYARTAIQTHARRFSVESFAAQLHAIVHQAHYRHSEAA